MDENEIFDKVSDPEYERYLRLQERKDEMRNIFELARTGDADAQCTLGDCYYFGFGVERDYVKATEMYIKAADQGYDKARLKLEKLK